MVVQAGARLPSYSHPDAEFADIAFPFVLSVLAGATDIIGFLGLDGLFTAHITGNFVVLAAHLIDGNAAVSSYLLAVPVYMLVLLLTRMFAARVERKSKSTLATLLALELLLLFAFMGLSVVCRAWVDPTSGLAVTAGMLGVSAMAVQSALVQLAIKRSPSTSVMTTNLTSLMLALADLLVHDGKATGTDARARVLHFLPVVVGFTLGCVLGASLEPSCGAWSLGLPAGLSLLAFAMSTFGDRKAV